MSPESNKVSSETNAKESPKNNRIEVIQEDTKEDEAEDDDGLPTFPYERLTTSSSDPVTEIDVTKREVTYQSVIL